MFQREKVELDPKKRRQLNRQVADFLPSFEVNHCIIAVLGVFFWPIHRDIKVFSPPQRIQYVFMQKDLGWHVYRLTSLHPS